MKRESKENGNPEKRADNNTVMSYPCDISIFPSCCRLLDDIAFCLVSVLVYLLFSQLLQERCLLYLSVTLSPFLSLYVHISLVLTAFHPFRLCLCFSECVLVGNEQTAQDKNEFSSEGALQPIKHTNILQCNNILSESVKFRANEREKRCKKMVRQVHSTTKNVTNITHKQDK